MARGKNGSRKGGELNPAIENRLNGGDEHFLAVAGVGANERILPPDRSTFAISLTTGAYTQNFDSLSSTVGTGVSTGIPTDWSFGRATTVLTTYNVATGSSNTGAHYSFGVAGTNPVTDRAFGSIASGGNTYYFGANFTNGTGGTITSLLVSYFGEQWRMGSNVAQHKLDFQISFDATTILNGTWTDINALDFTGPIASAAAATALDGNLGVNRVSVSSSFAVNILSGASFWIRWMDVDDGGNDHGLAVDDFSMTATLLNTPPTLTATGANTVYLEDALPVNLFSSAAISTVEAGQSISSMTFTVTNVTDGAAEILRIDGSNVALTNGNALTTAFNGLSLTVSVAGTTATVTFTGSLAVATAQLMVNAITYQNTSQNPTDANRVVTITRIADSGSSTAPSDNDSTPNISATVNVEPVNDPPAATDLAGDIATFTPGVSTLVHLDSSTALTLTNVDSPAHRFLSVSIVDPIGQDALTIDISGTGVTFDGDNVVVAGFGAIGTINNDASSRTTIVIDFIGGQTVAAIQTLMRAISYTSDAATTATAGTRTIQWGLQDGGSTSNGGNPDLIVTTFVNVVALNNAGSLSMSDAIGVMEGPQGDERAITFTVTRGGGSTGAVSATWTIDSPGGPTWVSADDFVATTGTVSFIDGQTTATITVLVHGDFDYEEDEDFYVVLSAPTGGVGIDTPRGISTILADDGIILGTTGNDNDVDAPALIGTSDDDYIQALAGDDEVSAQGGNDQVEAGEGDDFVSGAAGADRLYGEAGIDVLDGGQDNDSLYGGDDHDRLIGGAGIDYLEGGDGDDYLSGGTNSTGGTENDTLHGGAGIDRVGYFTYLGGVGVSVSLHLQGFVQDTGSQGFDLLTGFENLSGTSFADVLGGDNQSNWIWGAQANFRVNPTTLVTSTTNNDEIYGYGGDDVIWVGIGDHALDGGGQIDTLRFTENFTIAEAGLTLSLLEQGNPQVTGNGTWTIINFENLVGGQGGDHLTGDGDANMLIGERGNDTLDGGAGNDTLSGDLVYDIDTHGTGYSGVPALMLATDRFGQVELSGNDQIDGGAGSDTVLYYFQGGSEELFLVADDNGGPDFFILRGTEQVARIHRDSLTATVTVTGLNSGAHIGVDTLTNVETISFAIEGGDSVDYGVSFDPVIGNFAGDVAYWTGSPALLDVGGNATFTDPDTLNYNFGQLVVSIDGGSEAEDVLSILEQPGVVDFSGPNVRVGGVNIGTGGPGAGGAFLIMLNSAATPARLQTLLHALTYQYTGSATPDYSPRAITIDLLSATGGSTSIHSSVVFPGSLAIDDLSQAEGSAGANNFTFTVHRTGGTTGAVSATWTLNLSGNADGVDFTGPSTGTVNFADGQDTATITISVFGDTDVEPDETFGITLSAPTGGSALADATALGTIVNDDAGAPGVLFINDVSQAEGNAGTTVFTFTVTRVGTDGAVGASWSLFLVGEANAADFTVFPQGGVVSFANGQTTATITVNVAGDVTVEPNEMFLVYLSDPTGGATIADEYGAGTILNDDVPPPVIDLDSGTGGIDYATSYTENGTGTPIGSGVTITNAHNNIVTAAVIELTSATVGDLLTITMVLPSGISILSQTDTQIQLTGQASAAVYAALIQSITYRNTTDYPTQFIEDRSVTVVIYDDQAMSQTATASIDVIGVNDIAQIAGPTARSIAEEGGSTGGTLTIIDPDYQQARFVPYSASGTYGGFSIVANGVWSYDGNNNNSLRGGETVTDTFRVYSFDNSAFVDIVVSIVGANDAPSVAQYGVSGSLTEDSLLYSASGQAVSFDPDHDEHGFRPGTFVTAYGTFVITNAPGAQTGDWTYQLNNASAAVQGIRGGETIVDSTLMTTIDGSFSFTLQILIHGVNDAATITGDNFGEVTEDIDLVDSGQLLISDADNGENEIVPQNVLGNNGYGTFLVNADGSWTYTLNNAHPTIQSMGTGFSVMDTITVTSKDGTDSETITVLIHGQDEGANTPPVVADGVADHHSAEDNAVLYSFVPTAFSDPESEPLNYSATLFGGAPLPFWLHFDSGTRTFSGTPPADFNGTLQVTVTATDPGGLSVSDDFDLVIDPVNDAPTISFLPPDAHAVGAEARVNSRTAGNEGYPVAAALNDGSYVVVWEAGSPPGGIRMQHYSATGVTIGAETQVHTAATGFQARPAVAVLDDGSFVVTWQSSQDSSPDVWAQRFSAAGVAQGGEFRVNTTLGGNQDECAVTATSDGGFVVTWQSILPGGDRDIYLQRYNAAGVAQGSETLVNTVTAGEQFFPVVTALSGGGFVVSWQNGNGVTSNISAQLYNAAGAAVGSEVIVNATLADSQAAPAVAGLNDGGYVVTWMSLEQDGSIWGIYAQRFNNAGAAVGGEILVNTATAGFQMHPFIAGLADGGWVITWMSYAQGADAAGGVYAQQYDAAGVRVGGETHINTYTALDQQFGTVAALPTGGYVFTWMSDGQDGNGLGVYAQQFEGGFAATEQVAFDLRGTIAVGDVDAGAGAITVTLSVDYGLINASVGSTGVGLSGQGTATLIVTGTLAQVQTFLAAGSSGSLAYLANTDAPPASAQLSVTVNDGGNSGAGDIGETTATQTITIYPVNDPTVVANQIPDQHSNEDAPFTYQIPADTFSDPDGLPLVLTVTLADGNPLPSWLAFDPGTRTLSGTPPLNFNGILSLRVTASENGGSASDIFDLIIDPANDAPVNDLGNFLVFNEDAAFPLGGMSIADDGLPGDTYTVQFSVAHGTLFIRTNVAGGITTANIIGGAQGSNGITITGTLAQINETLAASGGLSYTGDLNFNGTDSLRVSTWEGVPADAASFGAPLVSSALTNPTSLVTGDVNGDGRLDLVYIGDVSHQIGVNLGNGDGTFAAAANVIGGANPSEVILADVDGDLDLDIVSTDYAGGSSTFGSVGVNLNNGSGGFGAYQVLASLQSPFDLSAADLNGDGRMDLVAARRDYGIVSVLIASGPPGSFAAAVNYNSSIPNNTTGITLGDFNNDGRADIVAFNQTSKVGGGTGTVSLLLNNGDGTFGAAVDIFASGTVQPFDGRAYDLNNDGNLDLVFANYTLNDGLTVMLGNGNGTFGAGTFYATAGDSTGLTIGDVNGDGIADLIAGNGAAGTVGVFIGNGNGTFQARVDLGIGAAYAETTALGDFDGDGDLDIAVNRGSTTGQAVLLNTGTSLGDTDSRTLNVLSVNDAPTSANLSGDAASYTEGQALAALLDVGSNAVIADVDSANFDTGSLTVSITGGLVAAQDQLVLRTTGTVSFTATQVFVNGVQIATYAGGGAGGAPLAFTFNADATLAAVSELVRAIAYTNSSTDNPTAGPRTIGWSFVDGDGMANGGVDTLGVTTSVNVIPVNDAPTLGNVTNNTASYQEGGAPALLDVLSNATVGDVDSPNFGGGSLTVALTANPVPAEDVLGIAFAGLLTDAGANMVAYNGVTFASYTGGSGGTPLVFTFDDDATPAAVQALVRAISYANSNTLNPSTATRTVTWTLVDGDGVLNGGAETRVVTSFVAVTPVNDAPSGTDATIVINEDAPRTLNTADFGFSDGDGHSLAAVIITTPPTAGTLLFNGNPVMTPNFFVLTSDINAGKLVFVPASNANGDDYASFTFQVVDSGGDTNGGQNTDPSENTLTIDVNAVNDAPVITAPVGVSVNEDGTLAFTGMNAISASDVDVGSGHLIVTISVTNGTLTNTNFAGPPFTTTSFSGSLALVNLYLAGLVFAPTADFNGPAVLDITVNDQGQDGLDPGLSGDGASEEHSIQVAITVNPANDAPTLANLNGDTVTFTEDGPEVRLDFGQDAELDDIDSVDFAGGTMTVAVTGALPEEYVSFQVGGRVTASFGDVYVDTLYVGTFTGGAPGQALSFSFDGNATPDRVEAILRALTYFNGNGVNPVAGPRTVTITLNDGDGTDNGGAASVIAQVSVNIAQNHEAPAGLDAARTIPEDGSYTFAAGDFGFSDGAEGDAFLEVIITTLPAHGALTLNGGAVSAGQHIAVGSIPLLVFTPAANGNGAGYGDFTFQVRDNGGTANGGQDTDQSPNAFVINVTAVNDAPVVIGDGTESAATINEDTPGAGQTVSALFAGQYSDAADNQAATGGSSPGQFSGIAVTANGSSGATGQWQYFSGGVWIDIGTVSDAAAKLFDSAMLLRFNPAPNFNGTAPTLTVHLIDNSLGFGIVDGQVVNIAGPGATGGTSAYSTGTVVLSQSVTAINDAPVNTVPGTQTINEDASVTLSTANSNALSVADVDATTLTVTLSVAHGTLTIASTLGLSFSGGSDGTSEATMTFSGTAAAINAALGAGLTYNPNANFNGSDTITVFTTDGGQSGTGPAGTDSDTITINITAINDAPVVIGDGTESATTINEDTPGAGQTIQALFAGQYSDAADNQVPNGGASSPGQFSGIAVTANGSSAATGQWQYFSGGVWTDIGAVSDGAAKLLGDPFVTLLRFNPALNFNGPAPTLTVHLIDNSLGFGIVNGQVVNLSGPGATGGATAYSTGTVVLSQDVTAVNDTPINTVPGTQTINEDASVTLSTANANAISVADVDATTLTVTLSVAHGTLTIASTLGLSFSGGSDGTNDATMTFSGTAAAINAALGAGLTYNPNANFNGTDTITLVTTDSGQTGTGPAGTDNDTITVNISAINDAPVVIGDGTESATTINEDTPGAGQTVSTLFSGQYSDAADNQVPNGGASSPGQFSGIAVTANGSSGATGQWQYFSGGVWTDIGTASDAAAKLFSSTTLIRFNPALNYNGAAPTLTVHLIDNSLGFGIVDGQVVNIAGPGATGGTTAYSSGTVVLSQSVTAVNDTPVVDLNGAGPGTSVTLNYTENAAVTAIAPAGTITDVDTLNFDNARLTVTITNGLNSEDVLSIINQGTGAGQIGYSSGTITYEGILIGTLLPAPGFPMPILDIQLINGTVSPAAMQALLRAIGYSNTSQDPSTVVRNLNFQFSDGDGAGGVTSSTATINVASVNDEPSSANVTISGVSEDDPYTFQTSDFAFSDTDGDAPLAVVFTTLPADGDILLNGVAILAGDAIAYSAIAAGMLTFVPDPDEFGAPYTSFTFQVRDNGGTANGDDDLSPVYTATINVAPDNLPPVVDLNGAAGGIDYATTYVEDGTAVSIGSGILISDPNSGTGDLIERATITLTDRVAGDSLILTAPLILFPGISVVTNMTASGITIQITGAGTATQYQMLLASVLYSTTSQDPTLGGTDLTRVVTVTVGDGEESSAVATTTINITPVDDAPVAQSDAFVITESGTITAGNLFANNGSGADGDVDGPALSISAVNGSGANVGTQITLASGALLTVNANGTFNYNPNGVFLPTPAAGSGASNTPAHDSFTYTLAGGNTVTVSITLTGLDTNDLLLGTDGVDIMFGGAGNDGLLGYGGNDTLAGEAGNDSLHGGAGVDGLLGGDNDDFLSGGDDDDFLHGQAGSDTLLGGAGNDFLSGGDGINIVYGGTGNDIYVVSSSGDFIVEAAGEGSDIIYTAVDFTLSSSQEVEILSAGDFAGTANINLGGNERNDILWGNAGANVLSGGLGADNLHGFNGADGLLGGDGNDFLDGGEGDDSLHGQDGNDTLIGAAGNDFLSGGAGIDVVYGGAGNDTYIADAGDYIVEAAGEGSDLVYATASFALSAGQEIESLFAAGTGAINLTGNELANTLQGNAEANILDGKGGNDVLVGLAGADTFAFTTALGAGNVDTVSGFEHGIDKIALDDAIFTALGAPGPINPTAFVVGGAAADALDRIIYNSATGQLFYDADGTGVGAAVQFATLNPGLALSANDFIVI